MLCRVHDTCKPLKSWDEVLVSKTGAAGARWRETGEMEADRPGCGDVAGKFWLQP
jgi:hypothetical protein